MRTKLGARTLNDTIFIFFIYYLFTACPITTVILHAYLLGLFTMLFTYITTLKRCNVQGTYITNLGYRMEFGL